MLTHYHEKRGKSIDTRRILNAAQAAIQPVPQALGLSYDNLFTIQRVRNPFLLRPVSYSKLASYLECPWCTHIQKPKKRTKEPAHFTPVQQGRLFGSGHPDARMVGTLLHTLINLLHVSDGPITPALQTVLLRDADALIAFVRRDMLTALQQADKVHLATFFNELSQHPALLHTTLITPLLHYQRELLTTQTTVFSAAERFQCKLLSTSNTIANHPDRGGYVGLVGEFDQIRLRKREPGARSASIPVIVEFKKGLGKGKPATMPLFEELTGESEDASETNLALPTVSHAMQLMIYWLAFQTRWDLTEQVQAARGMLQEIAMPLEQELELVLYNLSDGCQYQLRPTDHKVALMALIECIFYLDWALKSGYTVPSPDHHCQRIPLTEVAPESIQVQVGHSAISAQECYQLARASFASFQETIRWERYPAKYSG